jgi:hypothetical protein
MISVLGFVEVGASRSEVEGGWWLAAEPRRRPSGKVFAIYKDRKMDDRK